MRLLFVPLALLTLTSVTALSQPTSLNTTRDEQVTDSIDKRQVADVINHVSDLAGEIFKYLTAKEQSHTITAVLNAAEPGKTGAQLLQEAIIDVEKQNRASHNGLTSLAVRVGTFNVPAFDGLAGQNWGVDTISMTGSDGLSLWTFYWLTTGRINVVTSDFQNDVLIGGAYIATRAPTNPNSWTVTIVRSSP